MDQWEELEALVNELRAQNEAWSKATEALAAQLEGFGAVTEQIEQHYNDLAVQEALLALARRALNDAARLHSARLNYGLTRSAALVWYPMDDPRQALAEAPPEAHYSIEVRIGPRYLLGVTGDARAAGDQRVGILIEGEKQLFAVLPTTPEKFRAALLRAFQAPHYSGPPRGEEEAEAQPGAEAATEAPPTEAATAEPAAAEAATGDETGAAVTADGHEAPATGETAAEASASGASGGPSAAEPVIELPGASEPRA